MTLRFLGTLSLLTLPVLACSARPSPSPGANVPSADDANQSVETPEERGRPKAQTPSITEEQADPVEVAVHSKGRTDEDKLLDPQRKPVELLHFFQVAPGQKVAELAAGKGYTTELLARVVGPDGRVFGQNSPFILSRFAEAPWSERLAKPAMKNVVRVDSEFDSPLPPEARDLDAVFLVLFYHDTVWFETDRAKMNRAIFDALKPGGIYAVVDHSAKNGAGVSQAKTLHRIEESVLRGEIEAAGFVLDAEADFLKNPADTRDWNASPSAAGDKRGESDRFVLRFKKPTAEGSSQAPSEGAGSAPTEPQPQRTMCAEPRRPMCTREYRPVCAEVDTGIRCIQAPCPATAKKTYSNGCTACADPKVSSYVTGPCASE